MELDSGFGRSRVRIYWQRVYNRRRGDFVLNGKKDKGNWCWRTWDLLKKLGMEETWTSEYTGKLGEWRKRCAEKIDQHEKTVWRRDVEKKSRLSTYAKVKGELKREKYWTF